LSKDIAHVGLIPDGARRWAAKNGCTLDAAYDLTMRHIADIAALIFDCGIRTLSVYLLSADNIRRRTERELRSVIDAETRLASEILPPLLAQIGARANVAGQKPLLPDRFVHALDSLERATPQARAATRTLNLLVAYDPWLELDQAMAEASLEHPANEQLWIREDVDAVLRSGGANRLSGFLPLQARYAELLFLDDLFLDLTAEGITSALDKIRRRQRRLGS